MGRRERFTRLTDAQLRQIKKAELAKQRHNEERQKLIEQALRSKSKDSLVQILTKLCEQNIHARWCIETELDMAKPVELILHDLREAIRLATQVDDKRINENFPVDWKAYEEVKRLMQKLVFVGAILEAMEIAIYFMGEASRQIEYSDEGLMQDEVEASLQPIFEALENHDETQRALWALQMQRADRVRFVCRKKLQQWSATS